MIAMETIMGMAAMIAKIAPVGSRVTCDPPPEDTDEDYLILSNSPAETGASLEKNGFKQDGSPEFYTGNDNGGFRSYRRGNLNVIVTGSTEFFELFMTATALAKRFNLLAKDDRIALFQAILYGVHAHNLR